MKEFEFTFDKGLRTGLRKHFSNPRNEQGLVECHNLMPTEGGPEVHEAVTSMNASGVAWGGMGTVIGRPSGVELLRNTSFEVGAPSYWTASNSADLDRHADPHTGTYCLEINENGGANPVAYQRLRCDVVANYETPILAEKDYRLSVWVKKGTGTSYRIRVYDSTNTVELDHKDGEATSEWVRVILDVTTNVGTDDVIIELYHIASKGAGTTVLFDDVSFRRIEV